MRAPLPALLLPLVTLVPGAHGAVAPERAEVEMTTVTLDVETCPDCTFALIQSKKNGSVGYESEAAAPDDAGQVVFTVPTAKLRGVLIVGQAPDNSTGLAQYVISRFKGLKAGDAVTSEDAESARKGSPCWAGTHRSAVELDVTVERRVGESDDQQVTYEMYTSTTQRWWDPMVGTLGGTLETFDVVPCSKRG